MPSHLHLVEDVPAPYAHLEAVRTGFALCDGAKIVWSNAAFEDACGGAVAAELARQAFNRPCPGSGALDIAADRLAGRVTCYEGSMRLIELVTPSMAEVPRVAPPDERDPLSGLMMGSAFDVALEAAVAAAARHGTALALFHLEFPQLDDLSRGTKRETRVAFVRQTARQLDEIAGEAGVTARLEGARFAILLPNPSGAIEDAAARLLSTLSTPQRFADGTDGMLRPRIGYALTPDDTAQALDVLGGYATGESDAHISETAASLTSCADLALEQALTAETVPCVRFTPALVITRRRREVLARAVGPAVTNGEMKVAFQPVMDIASMRLVGFEALLRWRHPEYGPMPPPEAVALAEANGALCDLTRAVMQEAVQRCAQWPEDIIFAVNVSPSQLNQHLLTLIADVLDGADVEPRRLEIEVTEDALIRDVESSARIIDAMRELGVRVAMDDFGAGFTSLRNLKRLAFDKIKIDRSLCEGLGENERTGVILSGLVGLAQQLGIDATVEGVETDEQLAALSHLPCLVQGYVFSPPVPASGMEVFRPLLASRRSHQRSRPASRRAAS